VATYICAYELVLAVSSLFITQLHRLHNYTAYAHARSWALLRGCAQRSFMHLWFPFVLLFTTFPSHAQNCPRLEGRFYCRGAKPFDLTVENQFSSRYTVYKMTDPTETNMIFADGQPHQTDVLFNKAQYVANCQGRYLQVESRSSDGVFRDQYYIDRAAFIRVRIDQKTNQVSVLSCAPTHGTWNLYPH
jgi:hypothetical protein